MMGRLSRFASNISGNISAKIVTRNPLVIMPLILQGISLSTTIAGSKIIFPENQIIPLLVIKIPIYIVLGLAIQASLIVLLIFGAGKNIPTRKFIAVFLLTFFSTYTSFFLSIMEL